MKCLQCDKNLLSEYQIKFCSRSCSAIFNNKNKNRTKNVTCYHCNKNFNVQNHITRIKYSCKNCISLKTKKIKPIKELNCKTCNVVFLRNKNNINYCSKECKKIARKKYKKQCINCNKIYFAEKENSKFCSNSCKSKTLKLHEYAHKGGGLSRSRIEKYVEDSLKKDFSFINFVFNDKKTIGSELDIYVPDLKIAFELNGIFHYEPIYGENTLNRIKKNDKQKFISCYKKGIELIIINLGNSNFSKKYAFFIYEKIYNIINKNLGRLGIEPSPTFR